MTGNTYTNIYTVMLLNMYEKLGNVHNKSHKIDVETQFKKKLKIKSLVGQFWKKGGRPETDIKLRYILMWSQFNLM